MIPTTPETISLKDFWEELGYSKSTFYRRLAGANLKTPNRLLSPQEQDYIRVRLGFPPKFNLPSNKEVTP